MRLRRDPVRKIGSGSYHSHEGCVPVRRMRCAIEDIVDSVYGVQDIENRIRVQRA